MAYIIVAAGGMVIALLGAICWWWGRPAWKGDDLESAFAKIDHNCLTQDYVALTNREIAALAAYRATQAAVRG
jgi:hypothetical protein